MKQAIFLIALLSQSYTFSMELTDQSMLTVINKHTQPIRVTYEPKLPGVDYAKMITLTSECICQVQRKIEPEEKSTWSLPLLKSFITIAIPGFAQLPNVPAVVIGGPIVVNAERNNEIHITQATTILGVIKKATY